MIKRIMTVVLIALLALLNVQFGYAAEGDEFSTTSWRIDSNGDLRPGTSGAGQVGTSSAQVESVSSAGDVTFQASLLSLGRVSASSSLASSSTSVGSTSVPYALIRKFLGAGAEATTLPNGISGQVLNIVVVVSAGGVWTITPTTSQAVTSWTMTAANDSVTLLYLNDTIGWIVIGSEGSTSITYNTNPE